MKGRKWGKLPSGASCFRTSSDWFARVQARVQKLLYRYASRKRYPTFLDYFRVSSSPFDSHGSPLLDYKLQLPLLLLQRLLHRNARERERDQQYRMKLKRVSYHIHSQKMAAELWGGKDEKEQIDSMCFSKYFALIISFRRNKYGCIKCGQFC